MSLYTYVQFFDCACPLELYGGKAYSLAYAYGMLHAYCAVPYGFAVSTRAYEEIVKINHLGQEISHLDTLKNDLLALEKQATYLKERFENVFIPEYIEEEIRSACVRLIASHDFDVAVRSSATAEDLPEASFAGLQESYLHMVNEEEVLRAYRAVLASLFTMRAVSYRNSHLFPHDKVGMGVVVQRMVCADRGCSGTLFTADPETGFEDVAIIASGYGLGEMIVQGLIEPDEYGVIKSKLEQGYHSLVKKSIGSKSEKMIYEEHEKSVTVVSVSVADQKKFSLSDAQVLELARIGNALEKAYSFFYKKHTPLDIEWVLDGKDLQLYIVQVRPLVMKKTAEKSSYAVYTISPSKELFSGIRAGNAIIHGECFCAHSIEQARFMPERAILVVPFTSPDWVPFMRKASAIVTERGGRTCHAALVARELGVPALVGTNVCMQKLITGQKITVDCSQGSYGYVYEGYVPYTIKTYPVDSGVRDSISCKVLAIIAEPDRAWEVARMPFDGIGLVRLEFLMAHVIGIHPQACVEHENLSSSLKEEINQKIHPYGSVREFFIQELARGVSRIATAFGSRPVVVRTSDFKTNEYRKMIGGELFEKEEENPMIGLRGAARYLHSSFKESFIMECEALKEARDTYGASNMDIMIPFVRTVQEIAEVRKILIQAGLIASHLSTRLIMMIEVPTNVILLEKYAEYVDGFSIGSNDLTQLVLGVDRDSSELSSRYNELDPAVLSCIQGVIKKAHLLGKTIGICGQGPADFAELTHFLLQHKITSIALQPHALPLFLNNSVADPLTIKQPLEQIPFSL